MLATTMTKPTTFRENDHEQQWATYLPSPLLLQLFIENGWKIVGNELVPSDDQNGFVYLVTFKSDTRLQKAQFILPRTALIEKILCEHMDKKGFSAK